MAAQKKLGETATLSERFGHLEARVDGMETALVDLRTDVKSVLAVVTDLKVRLATSLTRSDLNALSAEVEELKNTKEQLKGGWRIVVAIASVLGGLVGALLSWFLR